MSRRDAGLLAMLLAATSVVFLRVLGAEFVWDELLFILQNPAVQRLDNIPRFLFSDDGVGTYCQTPYYRPLTTATFAIDYALWGENPAGFHAMNLLVHLGTCALLFLVVRRLTTGRWAPFVAALLFAVHPAHSEPVGYISARADLLCGLFLLASLLFYLRDLDRDSRRDRRASRVAYAVAILAKITAGVFPLLLAFHLAAVARRKEKWKILLPYCGITVAYLLLREYNVAMEDWYLVPLGTRLANAGPFLRDYMLNSLFPVALKVWYEIPIRNSFADPAVIAGWAAVAAGVAAIPSLMRRGERAAAFGIAWFFATVLPVSGVVMLLHPTFIADRYLYVPLIGLAVASGHLVDRITPSIDRDPWTRAAFLAGVAACALSLGISTHSRLGVWKDSRSLWSAAAKDAPSSPYVLSRLGETYRKLGMLEEADTVLRKAVELPGDSPDPYLHLAAVAFERGDLAKADRFTRLALALEPGNPIAMNYLGVAKAGNGKLVEALVCFNESIRLWPDYRIAQANLKRVQEQMVRAGKFGNYVSSLLTDGAGIR